MEKIIISLGVITLGVLVVTSIYGISNLEERYYKCNDVNGVLVRSTQGYICIDNAIVKTLR